MDRGLGSVYVGEGPVSAWALPTDSVRNIHARVELTVWHYG
ncbi:hypothetical protein SAMN04487914_1228 [Arthrobacter sp. ok909]|nr:hypothetical protein SAMN04487914_1228 [Arthrobacter sp. ok909]